MTNHSLSEQISTKLIRIVGMYVLFTVVTFVVVIVAGRYLLKVNELDQYKKLVATRLDADVGGVLRQVETLARSPVLGKELTEKIGRESYLEPLINSINDNATYQIDVLDANGRAFINSRRPLVSPDRYRNFVDLMRPKTQWAVVQFADAAGDAKNGFIVLFIPILSQYADTPVGYVIGFVDPGRSLEQMELPSGLEVDISVAGADHQSETAGLLSISRGGQRTVKGREVSFVLDVTVTESYVKPLINGAGLIALIVLAALLTIRRVQVWAVDFSRATMSRLDGLVMTCTEILSGKHTIPKRDDQHDEISAVVTLLRKIMTEEKHNIDQLRTSGQVFQTAGEAILITRPDGNILDVNPALLQITGYERNALIGKPAGMLYIDSHLFKVSQEIRRALQSVGTWRGETAFLDRLGTPIPVALTVSKVMDKEGNDQGQVAIFSDIRILKESEARLRALAFQDSLTGLPNYRLFLERLTSRLAEPDATSRPFVLLFFDMDRLKLINDTHGHEKGDRVIQHIAAHLMTTLPESQFICRRSGDEFIAIVDLIPGMTAEVIKQQLTQDVSTISVSVENETIDGSLSAGGVLYPEQAGTLNDLLASADAALQQAKQTGRGRVVWYSRALGDRITRTHQVEERLAKAIELGLVVPHYQPEVDMLTGKIVGFEALARWIDPLLGVVEPSEFISISEEMRLIEPLSERMLAQILDDLVLIHARFPEAKVAFNASPLLFHDQRLLRLLDGKASTGSQALRYLEIEVTESHMTESAQKIASQLREIQKLGVGVAIDDFGKGYSSFSRLADLPVNRLKIDASFVAVISDTNRWKIVRAIVNLAKIMELKVTAEGVETATQRELLLSAGCFRAQGWLYATAMPLQEVLELEGHLSVIETESTM